MATAEKLQNFIEEAEGLDSAEAFQEEHPYPFLVRERTQAPIPIKQDRSTTRLNREKAVAPIGDGFGMSGTVEIHRIFPRDPDNESGAVTVGRDATCDLVVDDGSISGLHARLSFDFDEAEEMIFLISDAGSSNGTFLNGERLEADKLYPLSAMDSVRFGLAVKFQFFTSDQFFDFMSLYRRIKKPS